ncbi:MAG: BMP family ABC transporter substrate-binding protein [Butyrivibrio sp.]|nr:BMP family ABC transporter substrate-binding protein [Butyrivibrio sp.]
MRKMHKILSVAMATAMTMSLVACGGSADNDADVTDKEETTEETGSEETGSEETGSEETGSEETGSSEEVTDMKVAMVTDYGDITDMSFNQTTYEACKAYYDENGVEFSYFKPADNSTDDRVSSIEQAIDEGYNVIVMPGYAFAEAVVETAEDNPDVKFVALDVSQYDFDTANGGEEYSQPNVFSAIYQEELPGYMAGYAAVKLGYTNLGFLGGMAVPAVIRYGLGFVQGADAAAAELGVEVTVNYAYGGQFYGDSDITAVMDTWYQGGTEVVFACGGGIYTSAAEAAQKVGGKVIGVDVDQQGTIDGSYGEGMTITSACKGLTATVNTLLSAIQNGEWDNYAGQIQNLGLVSADDLSLNYVSLADSTLYNDDFTEDDYKALVAAMFNGEVTVNNDSSNADPSSLGCKNVKIGTYQESIK